MMFLLSKIPVEPCLTTMSKASLVGWSCRLARLGKRIALSVTPRNGSNIEVCINPIAFRIWKIGFTHEMHFIASKLHKKG